MRRLLPAFAVLLAVSVVSAQEVKRADLKPGLLFVATDKAGFAVTRLEPTVGLTLHAGEAAHPQSAGGDSFTWAGYIQVVTPGKYKFDADVLGKLVVSVDGQPVLAGVVEGDAAKPVVGAEVELKAGIQSFTATLERTGKAVRTELHWAGPKFRREPIPNYFFGHTLKQRPAAFATDVAKEHGRLLFEEMSCVRCHAPAADDKLTKTLAERTGPNLTEIGKRAYPGWIDSWLADPKALRPNTVMPNLFADTETGAAERYAVTAYLVSLGGPLPEYKPPTVNGNEVRQSIDRGAKLYLTTGCAACHGESLTGGAAKKKPADDEDEPLKPEDSVHGLGTAGGVRTQYTLGAVGSKTRPEPLTKYLLNPLATNEHGRMPNMVLSEKEAQDLARHLCRVTDDKLKAAMPAAPKMTPAELAAKVQEGFDNKPNPKWLEEVTKAKAANAWVGVGAIVFEAKGCKNCHQIEESKPFNSFMNASDLAALPKGADKGCLAEKPEPGKVPDFKLAADQKAALKAFLTAGLGGPGTPSPVHAALTSFKRFGCLSCHARDGEGGIDATLADKMKTLETADNADDVQPPRLTGIGHKTRTSWAKDVILNAGRARPWMSLRMPQYGAANVGHLPESLPKLEGGETDDAVGKAEFTTEKVNTGRALAGKTGHGCISCHDLSGLRGGGTRGPDLATTNKRVRYDWYVAWMHQPQRMVPGTKMPQAFIDGKSLLTDFYSGDADKQVEALWAYFSLGPGLPLPAGMEPPKGTTVLARDRTELLRTFMPDNAGTKCIAVGFPGGPNAVFDSSQCRLGYAWAGNFLDVSPVWNDRGGNPAKLLGTKFWTAPTGHPWSVADSAETPDFAKRSTDPAYAAPLPDGKAYNGAMAVRFKGYAVDEGNNPTFRYQLTPDDGKTTLTVAEGVLPAKAGVANGIARKFSVEVPAGKTAVFNAGLTEAKKPPRLVNAENLSVKLPEEWPTAGVRVVLPQAGDGVTVLAASDLPADAKWRFVPVGDKFQALLVLPGGTTGLKAAFTLNVWSLPRDEAALVNELK